MSLLKDFNERAFYSTPTSALATTPRNIPKGSKYRIVLNEDGFYEVQERYLLFFWDHLEIKEVDRDTGRIRYYDYFRTYNEALSYLHAYCDRIDAARVVAYFNENGDMT